MSEVVVWFDGGCPLCRREIALMRHLDRRGAVTFVDASATHDPAAGAACAVPRDDLMARLHAREDGRWLSGAAAFAAMWRAIPVLRPLGLLARSPAVMRVLEAVYVAFLRFRPRLQAWMRRVELSRRTRA